VQSCGRYSTAVPFVFHDPACYWFSARQPALA